MGWGLGDEERREAAKLKLSATKAAAYNLHALLQTINHDDKRQQLLRTADNIDRELDEIERQLYR